MNSIPSSNGKKERKDDNLDQSIKGGIPSRREHCFHRRKNKETDALSYQSMSVQVYHATKQHNINIALYIFAI